MKSRLIATLGGRVLMAQPDTRKYGRFAIELRLAMLDARDQHAGLFVVPESETAGEGFLALESPDVRVLRPGTLGSALLRARWMAAEWRAALTAAPARVRYAVRREVAAELRRYVNAPATTAPVRAALRGWRVPLETANARADARAGAAAAPRYSRRRIAEPLRVALSPAAEVVARRAADGHGIHPEAPLVTLHVGEAGVGRPMDERKLHARDDAARYAHIEAYFDAVDELVRAGCTVVRIGDGSRTPVARRGVVDLATSPARTHLLEVWCLLRSRFLIAGEGGAALAASLTGTPTLVVNATDPIGSYPIREDGLYILKRVVDRASGRTLSIEELLDPEYQRTLRNTTRYAYYDNAPAEIAAAVREMDAGVSGGWRDTEAQDAYRRLVAAAAAAARGSADTVSPWRDDEPFAGAGRIGAAFVEGRWPGVLRSAG